MRNSHISLRDFFCTKALLVSITIVLLCYANRSYADEFMVITFNNQLETLRTHQVKMLYRGRLSHINGTPTRLMDLPKTSHYRDDFYRTLLNKSPSQMSAIWAKQSFSGKALAPFEIENESEKAIIHWLKHNKNGVAYVPSHLVPEDAYVIYHIQE
ncbi:hypothetical protein [Vibrio atypicus]|jgi:hypothetical protein|uniref:hypothetical protein n=1 Tax=Vibrio atypicus TaxID=558271 RepID=UPI00135C2E3E|nr:hypothetical protein [Vibrio atypicus]